MKIELDNLTNIDISTEILEKIASSLTDRDIELILCDNKKIASINSEYRGKNTPTDVLSFPMDGNMSQIPLGSIIISMDAVITKSAELGHSMEAELSLLFIHGLLHLMGYDHEVDSGEMRSKERELVQQFKLPESLIGRSK